MTVLEHALAALPSLPVAVLIVVSWLALGWMVLGKPTAWRGPGHPAILAAVGWYLQSLAVAALGWAGLLERWQLALIPLLCLAPLAIYRAELADWLRARPRLDRLGIATVTLVGLWATAIACRPLFHFDQLSYGFGQASVWLADGHIRLLGPDLFSLQALPARMQVMLALALGGDGATIFEAVLVLGFALSLCGPLLEAIGSPGSRRLAPLAWIAIASIPGVWELLFLRKDDLSVLWLGAAAVLLWIRAMQRHDDRADRIAMALIGVALVATKALVTIFFVPLATILAIGHGAGWRWRTTLHRLLLVACIAIAAGLPILVHVTLTAGSPLAVVDLEHSHWKIENPRHEILFDDARPFRYRGPKLAIYDALAGLGGLWNPRTWNFGDNLGLLILFVTPVALLVARKRPLGALMVLALSCWVFGFQRPRFLMHVVVLACLLAIDHLDRLMPRTRLVALVLLLSCAQVALALQTTATGGLLRVWLVAGSATTSPATRTIEWANAHLDPSRHRILAIGEPRLYPTKIGIDDHHSRFEHPFEKLARVAIKPERAWRDHLDQREITHLLVTPEIIESHFEWSDDAEARFKDWLGRCCEPIHAEADGQSEVFLLRRVEAPAPTNLE